MEMDRIPFTSGWRFALTEEENAVERDYDDSRWRRVDLPHDWQIEQPRREDAYREQGFFPRQHVGVYRLRFRSEEAWRGKAVRVLFDGAQRFSTVYLNGRAVGGRPNGYVPLLCDLTEALDWGGENVLAVRLDNRDSSGGRWTAGGGDRWYSGAGLYRSVWLLVQDPTHIVHDGIRVTATPVMRGPNGDVPDVAGVRCDRAGVSLRVEIEGDLRDAALRAEITDPQGKTVYAADFPAGRVVESGFSLKDPFLWTPENPALYRCVCTLRRGGEILDRHAVRFGVRSAVFDEEDGFVLNGRKRKLWGVNLHHDGGMFGAAAPVEVWKRRFTVLKSLGVNTIRASHNPMAEEVYDLLDEMGFLVLDELYDKWDVGGIYTEAVYPDWHLRDLEAMVRRDANHPSVILWSVGNEVRGQYTEHYFDCLREMTDACRRLDPTRGVTCALISFVLPNANDTTPLGQRLALARRYAQCVDVFSCNYMEHFYEKLRESGMRKPILGTEVRTYYRNDSRFPNHVDVSGESPYAVVRRHDWVCGAILWAGVDYLGESTRWPMRGWTGNILDSTADIKLRGWYCASQWSEKPVLRLAVFDESEPWDGARGMWGFPQMRRHWKYSQFEKVMHIGVMTNCDTVKLYQNAQMVRTGFLSDFRDGMVHFCLPYIPGKLRAEGYRGGLPVCEDTLWSDHEAAVLRLDADRTDLPAGGRGVAFVDVFLEDAHGVRYTLEDRMVSWRLDGAGTVLADNGNAWTDFPAGSSQATHNGHILLAVRAPRTPGESTLLVSVEGFQTRQIRFRFTE